MYVHAGKHKDERIMRVDNSHWHWGLIMVFGKHPPPVSTSHMRRKREHFLLPPLSCTSCLESFKVNLKSKETTLPLLGGTFVSRTLALSTLISDSL